jgi:PKD repeat protein
MADQEQAPAPPPKPKSWLKALLGTIGGLLSGAVMMYVTPLVNKVVQPPMPVANFEVTDKGLNVRFHNLSQHGQGRWDFGDGSPLENTSPDHEYIDHAYARPGDYTVKLSIQSPLGDKDERTAPVHVEAETAPSPVAPKIVSLEAVPVSIGSYAPATFRLIGKVENAQMTIVDFGDERLIQIATEHTDTLDELVTFQKPGAYALKLSAFNGAAGEQKIAAIKVVDAPANTLTAVLTITDDAMKVETKTHGAFFNAVFPADSKAATCALKCEVKARPGHTLLDVAVKTKDGQELSLAGQTSLNLDANVLGLPYARNLRLQLSDDKETATLTGELIADRKNKTVALPSLMLPVTLTVQKKSPMHQTIPVTTTLNVPANGVFTSQTLLLPPVPKDWEDCQRKFHLEVLNNGVKVYEDSQLQRSALVTLPSHKLILTTTQANDQVRIDLMDAPTGVTMVPK